MLPCPMPQAAPHQLKVTAQALYVSGMSSAQVSAKTGVPAGTVRKWSQRGKWFPLRDSLRQDMSQACLVTVGNGLERASETMRTRLAGTLAKHVDALDKVPAKSNLKHISAVGAALEPLVRSSKVVFDWGERDALGVIDIASMRTAIDAVDAVPALPAPCPDTQPDALPDTPTGSVPMPDTMPDSS